MNTEKHSKTVEDEGIRKYFLNRIVSTQKIRTDKWESIKL
jgi:hypothetical protein